MTSRQEFVEMAKTYLGTRQGDSNHTFLINTYNSIPEHRGCYMRTSYAWCAAFVSAIAYLTDNLDVVYEHTSCNQMIARYKYNGCWMEDDSYIPKAGDIIFYDWDDTGIGDNVGIAEHVGIVDSYDGNYITVIEGNMGEDHIVGVRKIKVNGRYIRGYGLPKFDEDVPEELTYTVVKGDSLYKIGKKLGIRWQDLAIKNGINKPYIIYPGQKLRY